MKKINKKGPKKSSKRLRNEIDYFLKEEDIDSAIKVCDEFMDIYPKNIYPYSKKIELLTDNYNKYISNDEFKNIKLIHGKRLEIASKKEIDIISKEFEEYEIDLKEKDNLEKTKKELIGNYLQKKVQLNASIYLNNILTKLSSYKPNGKQIQNVYDLIKGLFLLVCLIFNLFNINGLLFVTVPFGIYGVIIIYKFFDNNIGKISLLKNESIVYKKLISDCYKTKEEIKNEIGKIDSMIEFNLSQKISIIGRMPEKFKEELYLLYEDDEESISNRIYNLYIGNKIDEFKEILSDNTFFSYDEFIESINKFTEEFENKVNNFIDEEIDKRKINNSKFIVMMPIKTWIVVLLFFLIFVSISSFIILINNFYDMNLKAFIIALGVGIISAIIYNINTGKSSSVIDTFNDNLLTTIFNTSLTYDLIYSSITSDLNFVYCVLEVPIIFILILIGFVMLVSFLKYVNLQRKLRN